jgi:hypothetical protein
MLPETWTEENVLRLSSTVVKTTGRFGGKRLAVMRLGFSKRVK